MVEVKTTETQVESTETVEVSKGMPNVEVKTESSITAVVEPTNYVIASEGFINPSPRETPQWLLDAIQKQLQTGSGNIADVLVDLQTQLSTLELGVNQAIAQAQTAEESVAFIEASILSTVDQNYAGIIDVANTYASKTEAQGYVTTGIGSALGGNVTTGDVSAYIGSLAITAVDTDSATASQVDVLTASYNDNTARIDTIENVTVDGNGWYAGASKMITAPDGSITGWEFLDGSNTGSEFVISADYFKVQSSSTAYAPFEIDTSTGDIDLTGNVRVGGSLILPETTWAGGIIESTSFVWNPGETCNCFGLYALGDPYSGENYNIIGGKIYGANIQGGLIEGTQIIGGVIRGSYIDYVTVKTLTNWQAATDIEDPASTYYDYRNNFAKDAEGNFIIDVDGYYRLEKYQPVEVNAVTREVTVHASTDIIQDQYYGIIGYNNYTVDNINRPLTSLENLPTGSIYSVKCTSGDVYFNTCILDTRFTIFDREYSIYCEMFSSTEGVLVPKLEVIAANSIVYSVTASAAVLIGDKTWTYDTTHNDLGYSISFNFNKGTMNGAIGSVYVTASLSVTNGTDVTISYPNDRVGVKYSKVQQYGASVSGYSNLTIPAINIF